MRGFAEHPALEDLLVVRHLELRHEEGGGLLRVVPSDGPRVHGLSSTLCIGDEVWAWPPNGELLEADADRPDQAPRLQTAADLDRRGAARLAARPTAGPLSQASTKRTGSVVEARGDLHWLEWSVPDDVELDDMHAVKRANPAPWIDIPGLRRQRAGVPDTAFAQFHACR
jgi:hypothetical protein